MTVFREVNGEYVLSTTKDPMHKTAWDITDAVHAEKIAADLTKSTGELYITSDRPGGYPRYDVIKAPKIGDKVSYAFNGDSYPCGEIVSISKTMKKIVTSTGHAFYRYHKTAAWLNAGTWHLVSGHVDKRNPHF